MVFGSSAVGGRPRGEVASPALPYLGGCLGRVGDGGGDEARQNLGQQLVAAFVSVVAGFGVWGEDQCGAARFVAVLDVTRHDSIRDEPFQVEADRVDVQANALG